MWDTQRIVVDTMSTSRRERWRACLDPYGRCYDVSERGRVRRRDTMRTLKLARTSNGLTVRLCLDGAAKTFLVHRLVAFAFSANMTAQSRIRHVDGDVENNLVNNLAIVQPRRNPVSPPDGRHRDLVRGTDHHAAKLDAEQVAAVRRLFAEGVNRREIAERFGISRQWVHALGRGEGWVSKAALHELRRRGRAHDQAVAEQALHQLGIEPATLVGAAPQ